MGALAGGAVALSLAACTTTSLSGTIAGAGASSQEAAMNAWVQTFMENNDGVTVSYDAVGSGGGRTQFIEGGVQFAGTDAALKADELADAEERCGGTVIELPLYISPIAVIYNLPSVTEQIQMSAATIANVFNNTITQWDDPAIVAENPGVDLPDMAITPVHRSDDSGTTANFTDYLEKASGGAWEFEGDGDWPIAGGQSGNGTSGVVSVVQSGEGTIGYADASRAEGLGTVALKVGDAYVPFSPEAAAAVVDASPAAADASDTVLTIDLDRTTTAEGAYPLVLVSYSLACQTYEDETQADLVKEFLTYVASVDGQELVSDPEIAGSSPISSELRSTVNGVLDTISATA